MEHKWHINVVIVFISIVEKNVVFECAIIEFDKSIGTFHSKLRTLPWDAQKNPQTRQNELS